MPPPTSKPFTSATLLLLLSLSLTHAIAQSPLAPFPSTLSHLSALFASPPAPSTTQPPCCGPACPPRACNIHLPAPSNDLAYLFPLPTTTASPPSKVTFPCCGDACPDGACRASGALGVSERPAKPTATATAPPPEGGRLGPGFAAPGGGDDDGGEASIIIGCCKKCKGCIQSAGPGEGTGREEVMFARATGAPENGGGGNDDGKKPTPPGAGDGDWNGDGVRPPGQPGRPGSREPQVCVGCVGGICFPCISGARAPPVLFTPAGVGGGQAADTGAATATVTAGNAEEPQPTILMAADVADAVKGVNQDVVPVVVQSVGPGQDGEQKGKGEWELVTLLASVDLKVRDNYLSRKVVEALGLGDRVKGLKKGTGKVVVLDGRGEAVKVEGYVDLGIVIGSRSGIVIGSATADEGDGEWRLLEGVRWFVHGGDDEDKLGSPDVVLGTKVLAEAGGLSLTQGVRREVQAGVKVLGIAHFVEDAGTGKSKQGVKDEL